MGIIGVQLDHPSFVAGGPLPVYTAGQLVSGKVVLRILPPQRKLDDVSLVFKGKCNTAITKKRGDSKKRYKEQIDLFRFEKTLFRGPFTMQPQTMEWPFEFTIPTGCNHRRSDESPGVYMPDGPMPLPPTFCTETHSFRRGTATVDYVLKVSAAGKSNVL